jgi:hypothetical protein
MHKFFEPLEGVSSMKSFPTLILLLAFTFTVHAQEPTRPPTTTPTPSTTGIPSATWSTFTSETGRFSVLMPGKPTDSSKTVDSLPGPYTTHLFVLRNEPDVFVIGWVDYDPGFNFERQTELEANRDNFVKNLKATLVKTRNVKIDGYQAIEFSAETEDRIFHSRVYMVGRRPYQIIIGLPKNLDDLVKVNKFFNSFKVTAS